jgi:hypothetical protein
VQHRFAWRQIQRALPAVKVVKTLNTMNAYLMVGPRELADGTIRCSCRGTMPRRKSG